MKNKPQRFYTQDFVDGTNHKVNFKVIRPNTSQIVESIKIDPKEPCQSTSHLLNKVADFVKDGLTYIGHNPELEPVIDTSDKNHFFNNIHYLKRVNNLSWSEIYRRTKIPYTQLNKIKVDINYNPDETTLEKFAEYFNETAHDLLHRDIENHKN